MSRLNKWYNESKAKLEDEIWPKLNSEENKFRVKNEQTPSQQVVQVLSTLDHSEYPKLGEKVNKAASSAKFRKSAEIKQYYNTVNIMQKSRSKKVKSNDPITINLQHIINNSVVSKQRPITKRISKSESPAKSRRRVNISRMKIPSSVKKVILWEKELKRSRSSKELSEIQLDKLNIKGDSKEDDDIVKNLSTLNIFGQDYRQTFAVGIGDDTVESRPDLIGSIERLKIGPKIIPKTTSIECSFNRMTTQEKTLCEDDFNKSLTLNDEDDGINEIRFSRKFREYCTNVVTADLSMSLDNCLTELKRLQRKLYERDNIKGKNRRRFYAGFKEVEKYILISKIKLVIIATDIDKIIDNGILDKTVDKFTEICQKHDVAICYGLSRHKLGYFVHGKGIVSVIGIANYDGIEEYFEAVLKELINAKNEFNRRMKKTNKIIDLQKVAEANTFLISQRISCLLKIASSMT